MAWKSLLSAKLPAISRPIIPPFTARHLAVQVGTSKTKGFTISLQAAVYLGALAAGTLHTTTTTPRGEDCLTHKMHYNPSKHRSTLINLRDITSQNTLKLF